MGKPPSFQSEYDNSLFKSLTKTLSQNLQIAILHFERSQLYLIVRVFKFLYFSQILNDLV